MSCSKSKQGCCVWLTGLPCSGKTTLANALAAKLELLGHTTTVMDGDIMRSVLCPELGYSREDRRTSLFRIAFVAKEIVRHAGIVICATISPYREDREQIRAMFPQPLFVEVYIDTPLEVCQSRDTKGLYAKARRGEVRDFTGVDAPYEPPLSAEVICDGALTSPEENACKIARFIADLHTRFSLQPALAESE